MNVPRSRTRRWLRLTGCLTAIAVIWLYLLPALSRQPGATARLRWLERQGIDPSAMFYTELPLMDELLKKIERR